MIKRLGLVLECDSGGPDELVFRCLSRRLSQQGKEPEVVPVCMGEKKTLLLQGAQAAQALVDVEHCDLVFIVWDLKPPEPPARKCVDEANLLRHQIEELPQPVGSRIRLLCLTWELETWLLAEDRAVRAFLSTAAHACEFTTPRHLDKVDDPKSVLNKACTNFRGKSRRYVDRQEAIRLVRLWPDTSRVRKVRSFARFASLLTGNAKAEFQQCGQACADLAHQAAQMGR